VNMQRGISIAVLRAMRSAMTHCKNGHVYDDENKYINPRGQKNCRKCRNIASANYMARKR
jgi:hypothetical protein